MLPPTLSICAYLQWKFRGIGYDFFNQAIIKIHVLLALQYEYKILLKGTMHGHMSVRIQNNTVAFSTI